MNAIFSNNSRNQTIKKEKSLIEILQIVFRRRYVLISSFVVFLILAVFYNILTKPTYEAIGLLKKEVASKDAGKGDFSGIIDLQTLDELETEMELVKTWNVLGNVIDELKLNVYVKSLVTSDGETIEINEPVTNFSDPSFSRNHELQFELPEFKVVDIKIKKQNGDFFIKQQPIHCYKYPITDLVWN
ncbi:MAG: Wzz/FepE/Etk N-terminal domain-containing protein [Ignavibacteriaceae bacterium]